MISYIIRDTAITLVIDGNSYHLPVEHPSYKGVLKILKTPGGGEGKEASLIELVLNREVFEKLGKYDVTVDKVNKQIKFSGIDLPLSQLFYDDLLKLLDLGLSISPFVEFWKKVAGHESRYIVSQLYEFMKHNDISISSTGNIIGYKSVKVLDREDLLNTRYHAKFTLREVLYFIETSVKETESLEHVYILYMGDRFYKTYDNLEGKLTSAADWLKTLDKATYTDHHTGKTRITLNTPIHLDRAKCTHDPAQACASGLHIGSIKYALEFNAGKDTVILACEIDPRNVVSVPNDYNGQKMRCCEYVARSVVDKEFSERFVDDTTLSTSNYAKWVSA